MNWESLEFGSRRKLLCQCIWHVCPDQFGDYDMTEAVEYDLIDDSGFGLGSVNCMYVQCW
ncbi:hypothetical protein BOO88_10565 [Stutzerimonas stutzeri]|nr:hypothetical protein BOO88_10565 [Stutzerimonas stutzeri]